MNSTAFQKDYDFAVDSGEFNGLCLALRYVAAINIEATQKEFVAAAVDAGLNPNTAAIQFRQSRRESELSTEPDVGRKNPRKIVSRLTSTIRSKAREIIGNEKYDLYFNDNYVLFVTNTETGRTSYRRKTVTVPLWCYEEPHRALSVYKLKYSGELLSSFWIYYLAHELAHMLSYEEHDVRNHGLTFRKVLIEICPPELLFFELGYKPRNACAASITRKRA